MVAEISPVSVWSSELKLKDWLLQVLAVYFAYLHTQFKFVK
jgi:hypothetical protein